MCGEQKAEIPLFTFIACRHLGLSSPLEICWQIKPVTFINEIHQRLNIIFAQYLKQAFYFAALWYSIKSIWILQEYVKCYVSNYSQLSKKYKIRVNGENSKLSTAELITYSNHQDKNSILVGCKHKQNGKYKGAAKKPNYKSTRPGREVMTCVGRLLNGVSQRY